MLPIFGRAAADTGRPIEISTSILMRIASPCSRGRRTGEKGIKEKQRKKKPMEEETKGRETNRKKAKEKAKQKKQNSKRKTEKKKKIQRPTRLKSPAGVWFMLWEILCSSNRVTVSVYIVRVFSSIEHQVFFIRTSRCNRL